MQSLSLRYSKCHKYTPFVVSDSSEHTMGLSLERYVDIKIHHLIKEGEYSEIRVIGEYDRSSSISKFEKNDKITNWQRPTAAIEGSTLYLKCFPGIDYVKHYSSLVASYLAMRKLPFNHVVYSPPTDAECWDAVSRVGLDKVPMGDVIVLGYGLPTIAATDQWVGNDSILWTNKKIGRKKVTFLIVQFSYWGDILRRIVNVLAARGFETVIFTAKVGGIDKFLTPNLDVVTGNNSFLDGEIIEWDNVFNTIDPDVIHGNHVNSSSVMFEVPSWLDKMRRFDFVDSEIGEFAKGAKENKMRFGYLHYISNLLSKYYREDLSNERIADVLKKRDLIKLRIKKYIEDTILQLS